MSTVINGYRLTKELNTENAGMCQWGFAVDASGHEYFIKQFLSPKYPDDNGRLSPALVKKLRDAAEEAYRKRKRFYDRLKECRTGNNVVVEKYFRWGNFYYAVSDRIRGPYLSLEQIASMPDDKKKVLLRAILFNVMQFHEKGIVHSDLKPDNIMVRRTAEGYCTAKIIDFDAGFFSDDPPEEITGDQVYFPPEVILHNKGREAVISEKGDIFALGLLFHQYWCGALPGFNRKEHHYASEALLEGDTLQLNTRVMPGEVCSLVARMLSVRPEDRPSAKEAWESLSEKIKVIKSAQFYELSDDDL